MLKRTKISWADYSGADLGFIIGCTPVSEGCANCYAKTWARRVGRDFGDVTMYWDKLNRLWKARWEPGDMPYRRGPGSKPIMFPVDLGDLFHPEVDEDFILWALDLFAERDDADWVLLTKRPQRMLNVTNYWLTLTELTQLPPNIWCLVTAENQRCANERIPILLQVKAQVRGVSIEPMLGPIDLTAIPYHGDAPYYLNALAGRYSSIFHHHGNAFAHGLASFGRLHWVICGAESGPNRRPFSVAWAEDAYRQCKEAGTPFFGKQSWGLYPDMPLFIKGKEIKEFPTSKISAGT